MAERTVKLIGNRPDPDGPGISGSAIIPIKTAKVLKGLLGDQLEIEEENSTATICGTVIPGLWTWIIEALSDAGVNAIFVWYNPCNMLKVQDVQQQLGAFKAVWDGDCWDMRVNMGQIGHMCLKKLQDNGVKLQNSTQLITKDDRHLDAVGNLVSLMYMLKSQLCRLMILDVDFQ